MRPEWMEKLLEWETAGEACAEAILVSRQHSSPRMPGARLVVNGKGELAGGVSMGCVENDLRGHMASLLRGEEEEQMLRYGAGFDPLLEVGLSCGGEIGVWLLRHRPGEAGWKEMVRCEGREAVLVWTELAPGGARGTWRPGEAAPRPELEEGFADLWRRGDCRRLKDGAGGSWFAEARRPAPLLIAVGASPIAVELCAMAPRCGWRVAVVDPRRDFARAELFPSADRVIHDWPEEGMAAAGLDGETYVAILAHDEKLDVPALRAAVRAGARYAGLLGSAKTRDGRFAALAAEGTATVEELRAKVRSPIGLKSLGGVEPAEIAVSILGEMIAEKRGAI